MDGVDEVVKQINWLCTVANRVWSSCLTRRCQQSAAWNGISPAGDYAPCVHKRIQWLGRRTWGGSSKDQVSYLRFGRMYPSR